MSDAKEFIVLLFNSVSHAMMAENILKKSSVPHKLIPVPRHISSDCGVCLRIDANQEKNVRMLLNSKVDITGSSSL
jgi:hypothetical protein